MNVHAGRPLTDVIIYVLESNGLTVGDGERPDPRPDQGYVVVYGLPGGYTDGPVSKPDEDAWVTYQLTSVGNDRRQCEWVADKARSVLLQALLPIGDRQVCRIGVDMLGGVIRDDDVQPPVFYSPDRYRIVSTPVAA